MSLSADREEMKTGVNADVENQRGWFSSVTGKAAEALSGVKKSTWEHIGFRLVGPMASIAAGMSVVHAAGLESNASVMGVGVVTFGAALTSMIGGEEKARTTAFGERTREEADRRDERVAVMARGDSSGRAELVDLGADGSESVRFQGSEDDVLSEMDATLTHDSALRA